MERTWAEAITGLGQTGAFLVAALVLAALSRRSFDARWLGVAVLLILVHDFALTRFWWLLPQPAVFGDTWNWLGKILAIAATLLIAALPVFGWRRAGLTLRQDPHHWRGAWIGAAVVTVVIVGLSLAFGGEDRDPEALAYQLTMPGLEEEIFYRGLLLLALNEAFRARVTVLGAPMGWAAVLTALLFGLVHGLNYKDGAWSFQALSALTPGISGLILAWFREKSGSVAAPILLHNLGNAVPAII